MLLVTGLWTAWAPCAYAQLLDIRPDGTTALYKGPVIASPGEIKPLELFSATRPVGAAIANAAAHHGLSPALISAIAWQESHMRQDAVSPKGARGVMQLMPATARGLGVQAGELSANVEGGAAYLARLLDRYDGDIPKALAAYNAGPAAVDRYHGTPPYPETRSYVSAVLDRLAEMGLP